jgi:hypothetical protein
VVSATIDVRRIDTVEGIEMNKRKTTVACRELGVTYDTLFSMIRRGHIQPPEKDSSGNYWWSDADLEAVRQCLTTRDRRRANAAQEVAGASS